MTFFAFAFFVILIGSFRYSSWMGVHNEVLYFEYYFLRFKWNERGVFRGLLAYICNAYFIEKVLNF